MSHAIQQMIGLTVHQVIFIHDYLQLVFDDDSVLNIYCPAAFETRDGANAKIPSFVEQKIVAATDDSPTISLSVMNGNRIVIDASDAHFSGPESMTYSTPSGAHVVWP